MGGGECRHGLAGRTGALIAGLAWAVVGSLACTAEDDPAPQTSEASTGPPTGTSHASPPGTDTTSGPPGTSSGGEADSTQSTGRQEQTGSSTGVPACDVPDPDPTWLGEYQDQLVATLSGATSLPGGGLLPQRSSIENRAATADYLLEEFEALGLPTFTQSYAEDALNVYARLVATTDPDAPYLVVGAHYDTVPDSPGANDNATGVALLFGLARYLGELPCRSKNVLFVVFDEEEIGLVGSWHFARLLSEEGLPIEAAHTIDQMGWDADGDRAIEIERPDEGLLEIYQAAAAELGEPFILTPTQTGFTDHVSFRDWGFPAVGLTEEFVSGDTTRHYHLPSDTYDTVDLAYLRSSTVLVNQAFALQLTPREAARSVTRAPRQQRPASGLAGAAADPLPDQARHGRQRSGQGQRQRQGRAGVDLHGDLLILHAILERPSRDRTAPIGSDLDH